MREAIWFARLLTRITNLVICTALCVGITGNSIAQDSKEGWEKPPRSLSSDTLKDSPSNSTLKQPDKMKKPKARKKVTPGDQTKSGQENPPVSPPPISDKTPANTLSEDNIQAADPIPSPGQPSNMNITCSAQQGRSIRETLVTALVFSEDNLPISDVNVRIVVPFGKFQASGTTIALGKTDLNGTFKASWDHPRAAYDHASWTKSVDITTIASKTGFQGCSATCKVSLWIIQD